MAKIETIRHSLAHILAYAVQELYPGTKFGIGPAIENGFYYDFDLPKGISDEDLLKIEEKMKEIIRKNIKFVKKYITIEKAKEIFKDQPYKLELIKEKGQTSAKLTEVRPLQVSIYKCGNFVDLCKGPHVKSTKEIPIDAFKLTKIAGAYWRGSEKNPMLTRIYGLALKTKKELADYLRKEAEAEKRDHRLLGQKLDLFHIDENIGPGLILWHPKGAILKRIVENYALEEYLKNGYQLVSTPHIAKLNLWRISGHTEFYKENMFPPFHMAELGEEEKDDYQIKPMNCPFHIAIYKTKIRSYKDLPLRYTELGTVYRYEKSGVLHGLVRVRGFTQDDAHIFCSPEQLPQELFSVISLTFKILKTFGFKKFKIYLSTKPQKFVGTEKMWQKAENSLQYALKKLKLKYLVDKGGGAFYGPKIDIKIEDALQREWQCTTIQVDFNLPERFDITFVNKKGKKQRPIMIHRALLGSLERFIGVLIENYGGALPFWLSPEQIWIIPVGARHEKYAKEIVNELTSYELRVKLRDENETVSKKIREGEIQKIPYLLVVGDKEMKSKAVRIRERGKGDIVEMKLTKFSEKVKVEVEKKK
jgi:threonyl-tRNA synthetase